MRAWVREPARILRSPGTGGSGKLLQLVGWRRQESKGVTTWRRGHSMEAGLVDMGHQSRKEAGNQSLSLPFSASPSPPCFSCRYLPLAQTRRNQKVRTSQGAEQARLWGGDGQSPGLFCYTSIFWVKTLSKIPMYQVRERFTFRSESNLLIAQMAKLRSRELVQSHTSYKINVRFQPSPDI